ncbi:hypothetical protein EVAR_30517_1 [Eumeta japonica]|uniref:Uncharacterized protein n=1 Tax=Eumeta variegata TaxID=151549 RepID=A0A4C1VY16_EUMVA|nr:hypothetical protein EVAR_30517_1 [Eumeta japonica]
MELDHELSTLFCSNQSAKDRCDRRGDYDQNRGLNVIRFELGESETENILEPVRDFEFRGDMLLRQARAHSADSFVIIHDYQSADGIYTLGGHVSWKLQKIGVIKHFQGRYYDMLRDRDGGKPTVKIKNILKRRVSLRDFCDVKHLLVRLGSKIDLNAVTDDSCRHDPHYAAALDSFAVVRLFGKPALSGSRTRGAVKLTSRCGARGKHAKLSCDEYSPRNRYAGDGFY